MRDISIEELKAVKDEGLVFQGCGGDIKEWKDEINEIMAGRQYL